MELQAWHIILGLVGSAGLGGLVTAMTQAMVSLRKLPLEQEHLESSVASAIAGAAEQLVESQTSVLAARDKQVIGLEARVAALELQVQKLLGEIEQERALRAEREHELAQHRHMLAEQQETINDQAKQLRSQSARISALKRFLKSLGHDPERIEEEEGNA